MKKFSIFILSVIITGAAFVGCSSEEGVSTTKDNGTSAQRIYQADIDDYIYDMYETSFVYSDSIETSDSDGNYLIKAVTVGTDTKARGFLILNLDDKEPIGYIDVDRTNYVMKMIDMVTEEVDVIEDIDEDPIYTEIDGDFIQLVTYANTAASNNKDNFVLVQVIVEIGEGFWSTTHPCGDPFVSTDPATLGNCMRNCQEIKRRLWIRWSKPKDYQETLPSTACL